MANCILYMIATNGSFSFTLTEQPYFAVTVSSELHKATNIQHAPLLFSIYFMV